MRLPKKYFLLSYSICMGLCAVVIATSMLYFMVPQEQFITGFWPCVVISSVLGGSLSYVTGYKMRQVQILSAQLRRMVNRDTVTSTMSRRRFLEVADAERFEGVLVMVDIDHFKGVNDRFGHWVGDEALRHVAHALNSAAGETGLVSRYGGDEFVLAWRRLSREDAIPKVEKLRESLKKMGFVAEGREVPLTVSFGLAETHSAEPMEAALRRADRALYSAKSAGRDRVA
ncbi:MAG: GGDEF domain-containing protein [Paracoccaceae bacterium]